MQAPALLAERSIVLVVESLNSEPTPPLIRFSDAMMHVLAERAWRGDGKLREELFRSVPALRGMVRDLEADHAAAVDRERMMRWRQLAEKERQRAEAEALWERAAEAALTARDDARRVDALPDNERDALLRLARVTSESWSRAVVAIQAANRADQARDRLTACDVATAVAAVLDAIEPPPTECTSAGRLLVRGDEEQIREVAEAEAERWQGIFADRASMRAEAIELGFRNPPTVNGYNDDGSERADYERAELCNPRWHVPRLRRQALRAESYYGTALRMIRPSRPHVSRTSLEHWEQRQRRAADWALATTVFFSDSAEGVPLPGILANARKTRQAQVWATMRGLERAAERLNYTALFITITLPGEYHSYIAGPAGRDGSHPQQRENDDWSPEAGPAAAKAALQGIWAQLRARMWKFPELRLAFGISVPEPHLDGTPHLHAMLYVPRSVERNDRTRPTENVLRRELAALAEGPHQTKVIVVEAGVGGNGQRRASPASYVMKYVMKSLAAADGGTREDRTHQAWLALQGWRGFRFMGCHGLTRIIRKLYSINEEEQRGPRAGIVARHLRSVRDCNRMSEAAEDEENRRELREEATEAFCDALIAAGAVPALREHDRLRLAYETSKSENGRPGLRPFAIQESVQHRTSTARTKSEGALRAEWYRSQGLPVPEPRTRAFDMPVFTSLKGWSPAVMSRERVVRPGRYRTAKLVTSRPHQILAPTISSAAAGPVTVVAMYPSGGAAPRPSNQNQPADDIDDDNLLPARPPDRRRRGGLGA